MDKRRPIQPGIEAGTVAPDVTEADTDRFREAFGRWAATVTLVAVRDEDGGVHATTVSSFAPVSDRPPQIVLSLGAGAQALPWIEVSGAVGVTVLAEGQSAWASIYADPFPVRAAPWSDHPAPTLSDGVAALRCTVSAVHPTEGGSRVVICSVDSIELGESDRPLLYWKRGYRTLGPG